MMRLGVGVLITAVLVLLAGCGSKAADIHAEDTGSGGNAAQTSSAEADTSNVLYEEIPGGDGEVDGSGSTEEDTGEAMPLDMTAERLYGAWNEAAAELGSSVLLKKPIQVNDDVVDSFYVILHKNVGLLGQVRDDGHLTTAYIAGSFKMTKESLEACRILVAAMDRSLGAEAHLSLFQELGIDEAAAPSDEESEKTVVKNGIRYAFTTNGYEGISVIIVAAE